MDTGQIDMKGGMGSREEKRGGAILRTGQYAQAGSRLMCGG